MSGQEIERPELTRLADLIRQRNPVDAAIAALIGRPPHAGHVAEYVAAAVFGIDLHASASAKATDGRFTAGPLAGRSVNIKYVACHGGTLNLGLSVDPSDHPDVYLLLTGPRVKPGSSRCADAPWVIHAAYLFDSRDLLRDLAARGVRPKAPIYLWRELWDAAMVFPLANNPRLRLTARQRDDLSLFAD